MRTPKPTLAEAWDAIAEMLLRAEQSFICFAIDELDLRDRITAETYRRMLSQTDRDLGGAMFAYAFPFGDESPPGCIVKTVTEAREARITYCLLRAAMAEMGDA
jgi:hypothetical protein